MNSTLHRLSGNHGKIMDVLPDQVQVSGDGGTVWVHALDGSTVGRFSKRAGLDVHTTVTAQLAGASQCLHCTAEPAGPKEWKLFCKLIQEHFNVPVDPALIRFD